MCLFVGGFTFQSRTFHSYGDVTITGEWHQISSYIGTRSREAVTTCFYDLRLSQLGFKHNLRMRGERFIRLHHNGGFLWDETFINFATEWTYVVLAISHVCLQDYLNDWEITNRWKYKTTTMTTRLPDNGQLSAHGIICWSQSKKKKRFNIQYL